MPISTYGELQSAVTVWLNRSDVSAVVRDFIELAEARIARDLRLRAQVQTTTLTCVAGSQTVNLPNDWL